MGARDVFSAVSRYSDPREKPMAEEKRLVPRVTYSSCSKGKKRGEWWGGEREESSRLFSAIVHHAIIVILIIAIFVGILRESLCEWERFKRAINTTLPPKMITKKHKNMPPGIVKPYKDTRLASEVRIRDMCLNVLITAFWMEGNYGNYRWFTENLFLSLEHLQTQTVTGFILCRRKQTLTFVPKNAPVIWGRVESK